MSMGTDLDERIDVLALLKALAEPLRWRIVQLLAAEELCVCHLVEELDVPQPLVSHHLRVLRDLGVVSAERFRYWTYYRLEAAALVPLAARVGQLAEGAPRAGAGRRRPCC
jgi:ArsR family transcriptional regulator, arsenate/arsenite/antimonite-responsive transcriptional repressor